MSVQIISPRLGLTRKLPPPFARKTSIALEEEGDQPEDERVEGHGLGQRDAEPLDARDLLAHLRLPGDRLDHLAEDDSDADPGADRPEPGADAERDGLQSVVRDSRLGL